MKKLVGLLTLLAALGVFAVATTGASAEGEAVVEVVPLGNGVFEGTMENGGTIVYAPDGEEEKAQQREKSDCSNFTVCMWSGETFGGNFSWWPEFPKGCKTHEGNPNLHSGLNLTGSTVVIGGTGIELNYGGWFKSGPAVTGKICW
jgi:hypothetical protein